MNKIWWIMAAILAVFMYAILTGQYVCNSATVISVGGCDKRGWCGTFVRDIEGTERKSWHVYPVAGGKTTLCKVKQ